MNTVYIAGPITGIKDYEKNFKIAAAHLRNLDYKVVNPVELGIELQRKMGKEPTHEEYMNYLLPELLKCSHIFMLKGWEKSDGATLEREVAIKTGKTFLKIKTLAPEWNEVY